jgi:hypothetical protein
MVPLHPVYQCEKLNCVWGTTKHQIVEMACFFVSYKLANQEEQID